MSFLNSLVASAVPILPRRLVWRVARRYIAGVTLEEALARVQSLAEQGYSATLDILGEDVGEEESARLACDAYCNLLEAISARGVPSGISVKLSQLGILLSHDLVRQLLTRVVDRAARLKRFVRIDMEDSSLTSVTLDVYKEMRRTHDNVGVVLQSYLRRSVDDLRSLAALKPDVRICKGIYREPPDIAYQDREMVRNSFLELLERILADGGRAAIATHDKVLVSKSLARLNDAGASRSSHEFQMLLGVAEGLRSMISSGGWRVRIYVPFGRNWHAYSVRRLRENPDIAGHVLRDLFRKKRGKESAGPIPVALESSTRR